MFRLRMFAAGDGDCLLLSYGDDDALRHVVIDGGRAGAWKHLRPALGEIADRGETVELLVLTHIDADHIEGVLKLVEDGQLPIRPKRIWYNGFDQMARVQSFGERQGDALSDKLQELEWPVNEEFGGDPVSVETCPVPLEVAGLRITILSPDAERLRVLRQRWAAWRTEEAAKDARREIARAAGVQVMGRKPMPPVLDVETLVQPTPTDPEPPNGSSIAFLAEWEGRRVLLAGDAFPEVLATAIRANVDAGNERLRVDLFKVSHHGSHGNTTRELMELLDCRRFAISTNGKRHGHPDPEAIARLLAFAPAGPKELHFNYTTERTEPWGNDALKMEHDYETFFPPSDEQGSLTVEI